jgi:hypothetical protein
MAAQHLTLVPASEFPQVSLPVLQHGVDCEIEALSRLVSRVVARVHQGQCDYETEWFGCAERATVHHLASEQEFCTRHFQVVSRG